MARAAARRNRMTWLFAGLAAVVLAGVGLAALWFAGVRP
jgi:hypothetical protein